MPHKPFQAHMFALSQDLQSPGYSFRTLFGLLQGSGPKGPGRPCVRRRLQHKTRDKSMVWGGWLRVFEHVSVVHLDYRNLGHLQSTITQQSGKEEKTQEEKGKIDAKTSETRISCSCVFFLLLLLLLESLGVFLSCRWPGLSRHVAEKTICPPSEGNCWKACL